MQLLLLPISMQTEGCKLNLNNDHHHTFRWLDFAFPVSHRRSTRSRNRMLPLSDTGVLIAGYYSLRYLLLANNPR